ncbi:hypothetical protein DWX75_07085 [Mitsuokella sp. AF21-1AC]|nr:hypothetical protein DWX75_07085 [Mitsuokella sp. AF21-1AC]
MGKALRDVFRLQRDAEWGPIYYERQRQLAACRGVLTFSAKDFSCWVPALRAIALRLQAEYIPPLGFF